MSEEKKTGCECPLAGYCKRHGVTKSAHLHKMCQNHVGYFNMWENCRGPLQDTHSCVPPESAVQDNNVKKCQFCGEKDCDGTCRNSQQLPSKVQMAKNLASAAKDHAKTGFAHAENEVQESRLEICRGCEFYIPEQDRCAKCGCYLKSKSAWKASRCPVGKW